MRNKSDMGTMLREAGILFAITLIAGLLLGVVNELTREPIRLQEEKAVQERCLRPPLILRSWSTPRMKSWRWSFPAWA